MSNNIKVLFYIKIYKPNANGLVPLLLRVTFSKKVKQLSTGFYILPERWDNKQKRVKGNKEDAVQINNYILTTKSRLMGIFNQQLGDGDIDLINLIDTFLGRKDEQMTLLKVIEYHNQNFKSRIGIDYAFSTYEKYEITHKKIVAFLDSLGKQDMRLKDLTMKFISDFEYFLKAIEKNQHNTAVKYCKNLKKIMNMCVSNDWVARNPFTGYVCAYKATEQVFLMEHELKLIEEKEFQIPRLQVVKDLFIFQCYTGLAFADMASLIKQDIKIGIDGGKWLIKKRQKSTIKFIIPLLPEALKILDKYASKSSDEVLLPVYSIQRFNAYLHEIATICGLNKNISSHVGRRTFGNLALSKGISLNVIAKMMGHSNTLITQRIYAITDDQLISKEVSKLWKDQEEKPDS